MPRGTKFFGEGLPYRTTNDFKGKLIVVEGTDGVGRSTQIELLSDWLKVRGFGVVTTGWTRSKLMSNAIDYAKSGNMLDRMTFSLLYATDLADRLENVIIPGLKSGFIVVADRYVYTAWARDSLRDPSMKWIRDLYGFALVPDLVCYLRIDVENLIPRVIESGGMDYWESGMDLHLADNIYDSFKKYQKKMIEAYDHMAEEFNFEVLDARRTVVDIQNDLRSRIEKVIGAGPGNVFPINPGGGSSASSQGLGGKKATTDDVSRRPKTLPSNFITPGAWQSGAAKEKAFLPQGDLKKSPEANGKDLPSSSLWNPSFHILEDPQSRNS